MIPLSSEKRIVLKDSVTLADSTFPLADLPDGVRLHPELGVAAASAFTVSRIHIDEFVCHPRAIRTPGGDALLFYPAGAVHYGWRHGEETASNRMYLRRSADGGASWGPTAVAWETPCAQHAAIPFIPRGGDEIYVFGTEPDSAHGYVDRENAPLAWRVSRDDGRSWSPPTFIRPVNRPDFLGMSAMRMCETADGTWILGTHDCIYLGDRYGECRQYVLTSRDRGRTWTLGPSDGHGGLGWGLAGGRLHEGRPIHLGDGEVLMLVRTSEGHLWSVRSRDDGRTWTPLTKTPLKHLEAPPMLFALDNHTLAAFIHNRSACASAKHEFAHEIRAELWVCLSTDKGHTWSEPRFVMAEAGHPAVLERCNVGIPMVGYADLLVDGDRLRLFVDHEMRQILQVDFTRGDLASLLPESHFSRLSVAV